MERKGVSSNSSGDGGSIKLHHNSPQDLKTGWTFSVWSTQRGEIPKHTAIPGNHLVTRVNTRLGERQSSAHTSMDGTSSTLGCLRLCERFGMWRQWVGHEAYFEGNSNKQYGYMVGRKKSARSPDQHPRRILGVDVDNAQRRTWSAQ